MTNYADYAYYTDTYKGAVIDTASFLRYSAKATQTIKLNAFGRVDKDNIPEEVKMCCCELAELIYRHETTEDNGNIASEKVGEHSVSYVAKDIQEKSLAEKKQDILSNWLAMTGLLYRGCV